MSSLPKGLEITVNKEKHSNMPSLPKSLGITITKEQPDVSRKSPEPPKSATNKLEKPDQRKNTLLHPRTPPYHTGPKKEPGTEDEACEEAIASGDATPSWEGVWRKDRRDTKHLGPGGASN